MKIERDKVYLTRSGAKVRVICTDATEHMPVVGIDSHGIIDCYTENGFYRDDSDPSNSDLVSEYVEPPKPREVWVRILYGTPGYAFSEDELHKLTDHDSLVKFREVIE